MATTQERLYEILMERVRTDRYPSYDLLNRIEATMYTQEQFTEYVAMLVEKLDESWYPSKQMLDRVQRMLTLVASVERSDGTSTT